MTANLLDPHVSGAPGGTESLAGNRGINDRDQIVEGAALTGGAGVAGLGAHGADQSSHAGSADPSTGVGYDSASGQSSATTGPHKSSLLNKMDPRVHSDPSKQQSHLGTGTGSSTAGTSDPYATRKSGSSHGQPGEAGELGGFGATDVSPYEGRKEQYPNQATGTAIGHNTPSQYDGASDDPRVDGSRSVLGDTTNTTGQPRDHHLGRDAALGAGAGGLAYEAQKAHGQPTQPSTLPDRSGVRSHDSTGRPLGNDMAGSQLAGSSQQPATTKDHHIGRDAGLATGAGGLAYEADKHHGPDRSEFASTSQDQLAGSGHQAGLGQNEPHSTGLGSGAPETSHHLGRDATIGAATAGIGAEGKFSYNLVE